MNWRRGSHEAPLSAVFLLLYGDKPEMDLVSPTTEHREFGQCMRAFIDIHPVTIFVGHCQANNRPMIDQCFEHSTRAADCSSGKVVNIIMTLYALHYKAHTTE